MPRRPLTPWRKLLPVGAGENKIVRRRLLISGIVQGVGFRYWALRAASSYKVGGFVRNLPDGRVEAVLEGPEDAVDSFSSLLKVGPAHARVTGVTETDEPPVGIPPEFRVAF